MTAETNYRVRIETLEKDNSELKARVSMLEGANSALTTRILKAIDVIKNGQKANETRIGDIEITVANERASIASNFEMNVVTAYRNAKQRNIL